MSSGKRIVYSGLLFLKTGCMTERLLALCVSPKECPISWATAANSSSSKKHNTCPVKTETTCRLCKEMRVSSTIYTCQSSCDSHLNECCPPPPDRKRAPQWRYQSAFDLHAGFPRNIAQCLPHHCLNIQISSLCVFATKKRLSRPLERASMDQLAMSQGSDALHRWQPLLSIENL